jgi:hypothetical protein
VAVTLVVSSPALAGTWVYDDWGTAGLASMKDFDDLLAVFGRDSSAYVLKKNAWALGVTYRPLSMATLIAAQAALPTAPWLHHLISWALHVACVFGLYVAASRLRSSPGSVVPGLLAALFALHPVTIEAYGWINGRSDVLAGAFIMGLACALPFGREGSSPLRVLASFAAAAGAALSKEPALAAVAALLLAALLPAHGWPTRAQLRGAAATVLAGTLGAVVALVARGVVTQGRVSGVARLFSDSFLPSYARVVSLAIEHIILPLPRAMLSLAFELAPPVRPAEWLALATVCAGLISTLWMRKLRMFVLLAGALISLLPVLPVGKFVWLGFDRYLYLPLLLVCLAGADIQATLAADRLLVWYRVWFVCLLLLGISSFLSARAYANQDAWLASLIAARPDDASGYIVAAVFFESQGYPERAKQAVQLAPRTNLPPPLSHDLASKLLRFGQRREAVDLLEETFRRYPNSAFATFDAMIARTIQGRLDDVTVLAARLRQDPVFCPAAREWLHEWVATQSRSEGESRRIRAIIERLGCPAPT